MTAESVREPTRGGHTLPLGMRLREHEITGLIGEGGFGIVYLAWDHSLQRKVAIKEYMPASMASRVAGSSAVVVKSERHLDTFRAGLKSFVNEARLLARFDHPSLVKVYRFWEENGTAYMVMPFYEGPTLKTALAELGRPPNEAELRRWLRPLLDALRVMHAAQCFHRDIAPDNILLTARGPLLLDFGAARRVIGDLTHALTVVLKPGYAPIEQYGDVASMTQGPWTDLYALACVVYYAITGHTPASAVERLMDDRLEPLASTAAGRYSGAFLRAIDAALALRPQDRPQDDAAFRRLLDADAPPDAFEDQPPPSAHSDFESTYGGNSVLPAILLPTPATELLPSQSTVLLPPAALPEEPATADTSGALAAARKAAPPTLAVPLGVAAGFGLVALVAGVVILWMVGRGPDDGLATAASAPASAERAQAMHTSPAAQSASPQVRVETTAAPMVVDAEAPPVIGDAPALVPSAPATAAAPRTAAPSPAATTPLPRVRRDGADPPLRRTVGARCSDILQKASLETLTADEAAYLKKECR